MLEILIDNKDGNLWDISGIVSDVTYKTTRIGRASSLEFTFLKGGFYEAKEFKYNVGDIIQVRMKNTNVFLGFIFTVESGRDEMVKVTAYDQTRYLMVNEYLQKTNITATEVIKHFAERMQLKTDELIDTEYKIPKIKEDGVKIMDIICGALESTLLGTGNRYIFFDNFGLLTLRNSNDLVLDLSLGDVSLMFDYKLKTTIEDSYNMVVLGKDDKNTGNRNLYVLRDSDNIAKWGLLKFFQKVDDSMNEAQIRQILINHMQLKNRVGRSFTVDSLGDIRVRAGWTLSINIEEIGINQKFVVNDCVHKFGGNDHTMTLDLIDIRIGERKVEVAT